MKRLHSMALAPALLAALAAPALAQEQPAAPVANTEGVIAFTPADFASARPNTALDMINRLPGFTLLGGDQVRGFAGAAGNVLLDGQRPTIKTDSLQDTLGRIPIDQVERIDLIRGGAPGIDMQGQTVVANVIRRRVDTFQQVVQLSSYLFADTGKTVPGWSYQATRRSGEHQWDFNLSRGTSYDDSIGTGWRSTLNVPTGALLFQESDTEGDGWTHSGRINYRGPLAGGTFSANGLISTDEFKNEEHFISATTNERFINRSANDRGEIGLNYTRDLFENLELETLVLSKLAVGSGDSSGVVNGASSLFAVDAEAGETIGRSVLRYAYSPVLSFEGGGEVAFNYRESQNALRVNGAPVALPASDVRIEELRGEVFAQGTWRPAPQFTIEGGVRFERSTITQSGDTSLERSFNYPKPRLLATWSPTKNDQLRVRIEKELGQLNFRDFISNVNLNSGVLSAGNADLRPDQTWVYEAAFEKRFWENGAVVLTVRHEDISDVVDLFPFIAFADVNRDGVPDDADGNGQPDPVFVAGPGNIGDGTNDLVQLNITLPLQRLGVPGGEIKADLIWENSEVTDALTGEKRRISAQRPQNLRVNYRQDLPDWKLTYGFGWFGGWEEDRYLLQEVTSLRLSHFLSSFVEYKPSPNFTLRAELQNFLPYEFDIYRNVFNGPRGTGMLTTLQHERRNSQIIGMLRARWTFG